LFLQQYDQQRKTLEVIFGRVLHSFSPESRVDLWHGSRVPPKTSSKNSGKSS
jgi:hypothetical protein